METLINNPIEVGKGITDFGFLVMTAAGYLVYSAVIIFFFVKWFVRIINGIIERQELALNEILQLQKDQSLMLKEMLRSSGSPPNTENVSYTYSLNP
jgi:hypothetical protein